MTPPDAPAAAQRASRAHSMHSTLSGAARSRGAPIAVPQPSQSQGNGSNAANGHAADGFGRAVADPLAEAELGAALRRPRQGGETLAQRRIPGTQLALDRVEVERCADA